MIKTHPQLILALLSISFALAACDSMRTTLVDFDIQGQAYISNRKQRDGKDAPIVPVKMHAAPRPPNQSSPFQDLSVNLDGLALRVHLSSEWFSLAFTNDTGAPVLLHLDRIDLASNFQPMAQPLSCGHRMLDLKPADPTSRAAAASASGPVTVPPAGHVSLACVGPRFDGLFPSARAFGAQWDRDRPVVLHDGAGNAVEATIPSRIDGQDSTIVVRLTTTRASARTSYR